MREGGPSHHEYSESRTQTYYDILGVPENATHDEIKKAYRLRALETHPDRGGDIEEFKKLQEAFSTISNDKKRSDYDRYGKYGHGARKEKRQPTAEEREHIILSKEIEDLLLNLQEIVGLDMTRIYRDVIRESKIMDNTPDEFFITFLQKKIKNLKEQNAYADNLKNRQSSEKERENKKSRWWHKDHNPKHDTSSQSQKSEKEGTGGTNTSSTHTHGSNDATGNTTHTHRARTSETQGRSETKANGHGDKAHSRTASEEQFGNKNTGKEKERKSPEKLSAELEHIFSNLGQYCHGNEIETLRTELNRIVIRNARAYKSTQETLEDIRNTLWPKHRSIHRILSTLRADYEGAVADHAEQEAKRRYFSGIPEIDIVFFLREYSEDLKTSRL